MQFVSFEYNYIYQSNSLGKNGFLQIYPNHEHRSRPDFRKIQPFGYSRPYFLYSDRSINSFGVKQIGLEFLRNASKNSRQGIPNIEYIFAVQDSPQWHIESLFWIERPCKSDDFLYWKHSQKNCIIINSWLIVRISDRDFRCNSTQCRSNDEKWRFYNRKCTS